MEKGKWKREKEEWARARRHRGICIPVVGQESGERLRLSRKWNGANWIELWRVGPHPELLEILFAAPNIFVHLDNGGERLVCRRLVHKDARHEGEAIRVQV
jgi:hypothetical protein